MEGIRNNKNGIYVVEHLDPELGPWSALEYQAIARESASAGVSFCLSSVPRELELPAELREMNSLIIENQSVETVFKDDKERICLLDPKGKAELSPEDAEKFDVFLFGGILGKNMTKYGESKSTDNPRKEMNPPVVGPPALEAISWSG